MKKKQKIILVVAIVILIICIIGIITFFVIKNNNSSVGQEEVSSLELNIEYSYIAEENKTLVTITANKPILKLDLAYIKEGVDTSYENGEAEIIEDNYEYTLDEEFTLNEDSLIATRYYNENDTFLYRITFEDGSATFEYITISQIAVLVDMEALENAEDTSEETTSEETTEEVAITDTTSSSTDTSSSTTSDTSSSSLSTSNTGSTSGTTASTDTSSSTTSSDVSSTSSTTSSTSSSSSSNSSSSSEDDLSYWCVGGGSVHVEGDGENEHGYYNSWDEAYQALLEYTSSWSSMRYKVSSCACGLYYFWCIQE